MTGTPEEDRAGGPAFPTDYHSECPQCKTEVFGATSHGGMTLRDWFAGRFMAEFVGSAARESQPKQSTPSLWAKAAYVMADAMLEARKE